MALETKDLRNPALRNWADKHLNYVPKMLYLGTPVLADVDRIVTSANMKVGAYTIAAQPDVPRNLTVTATAVDTADTMGTITFVGTNYDGQAISEVITPIAGSTVAGTKAFKAVTSATGAGWVIDASEGSNDTITIGVGTVLGLPVVADSAYKAMAIVGTAFVAPTIAYDGGDISESTIDASSGTYNGTKQVFILITE